MRQIDGDSYDQFPPAVYNEERLNQLGRFSIYEFIAYACERCEQKIYSLFHDLNCLDERAMAWQRK